MPGESFLFQVSKMSSICLLRVDVFELIEGFFLMRALIFVFLTGFLATLGGFFFAVFIAHTPRDEGLRRAICGGLASMRYQARTGSVAAENLDLLKGRAKRANAA